MLPGAFSAYRWKTIRDEGILDSYLKQIINQDKSDYYPNLEEQNKYLAEDRIMCLEVYCAKDSRQLLKYLPDANATVIETFQKT